MDKKFDVSLIVTSKSLSLIELEALLEQPAQSGSHDKDEMHRSGSTWETTTWRQNTPDPSAPFELQCAQLLDAVPPKWSDLLATKRGDVAVSLDVAVFFETVYVSLTISAELIRKLSAAGIGFEITAYPCSSPSAPGGERGDTQLPKHGCSGLGQEKGRKR